MKIRTGKLLIASALLSFAVRLPAQPVITNQPSSQTVVLGGNATFNVGVSGTGPFTYQWQLNGTNLPNNIVTTIAGGNLNNRLPATNTILNAPTSVAVDAVGNIFIADTYNNVIRKVDTNGLAQIVAGIGAGGFAGDGGLATNSFMSQPNGLAVDTNGTIYFADSNNSRIRKIDTSGNITTVAGNGSFSGAGSVATNTGLNFPYGIALDSAGNFYIADTFYQIIRKVTPSGAMSTVAGMYSSPPGYGGDGLSATLAQLNQPNGVAVDKSGNIYIADTYNQRIRKVTLSTGRISTIAGTGTAGYSGDGASATSAKINNPNAVCLDTNGNIYIADTGNHCIRKITNGIISTVAGNGTAGFSGDGGTAISTNLAFPTGIAADQFGNLYITDASQRVRKVAANGIMTTVAGNKLNDDASASNATLNVPAQVAQDADGNFYIADGANHRIRKIDTNGIISTFAGNGLPMYAGDGGLATNASMYFPNGVALDAVGNVFISDQSRRIRKVDTNGVITTIAGKGTSIFSGDGGAATNAGFFPYALAVDKLGEIFIADNANRRVRKVDTNGIITTVAGNGSFSSSYSGEGGQATNAAMSSPSCLALDITGDLFIGCFSAFRILKVDTNGIISSVAGNGSFGDSGDGGLATNAQLVSPFGLTTDANGNFYFADSSNGRIRKVGTNGIITTVVGNGTLLPPVDNVPGSTAGLSSPRGMMVDGAGNLWFTDQGNNRLRKVSYLDYAGQPTFTVTNATPGGLSNNYSVIITSASGSVTSSVVNLSLALPPVTPTFTTTNGLLSFQWSAIPNLSYQLQYATNLTPPVWIDLGSPITPTNNSGTAIETNVTDAQRFYRVRLLWP